LLRDAGLDAVHTAERGLSTATDSAILEYAREQQRCVVTFDSDFHALMALSQATSPSVVRIRVEALRAPAVADLILQVLERCRDDLAKGAVVSVTRARIRLRHLPIGGQA
jgi:predicted nuclease of predicted toxin-antitoxin system